MSVEDQIERAFREAVTEMPYSSLSVLLLCNRAGVSRKAFYRRFKGKEDVLRGIFERDVIAPQMELCRLLSFEKMAAFASSMELHMFDAVYKDRDFYRAVIMANHGGEDAFLRMASSAFCQFNSMLLKEFCFRGDNWEADYVARFFADGKADFMAKWIREGFRQSPEEVGALYSSMVLPYWNGVIGGTVGRTA